MLDLTTGIDFLGIALRLALGERLEIAPLAPHGLAYLLYVQAPDDIHLVTAVTGLDDLRVMPGVHEVVLNRGPGHPVDWRDGNHGHVYSVLGTAEDHDGLRAAIDRVAQLVRIDGV